jgi:hypothetical protein
MANPEGAHVYGYLIVDRRPADLVRFPDGTAQLHPPGAGEFVAAGFDKRPRTGEEPPAPAGEPDEHEVRVRLGELHAAWTASVEAALDAMARDDTSLGNPVARRAAYLRRHPEPTPEEAREDLLRARAAAPAARARARAERVDACWWASFEAGEEGFDLPLEGPGAVPRAALAALLSRMSGDGWDLRHVSEDRGAQPGSGVACVAVNVLLSRPVRAEG